VFDEHLSPNKPKGSTIAKCHVVSYAPTMRIAVTTTGLFGSWFTTSSQSMDGSESGSGRGGTGVTAMSFRT
jgi:hypothetical protein